MFSSSSCGSENEDDDYKVSVRTLTRKRSYSVIKGCTTVTNIEKSADRSKGKEVESNAISSVTGAPEAEASTSREYTKTHSNRQGKRRTARHISRNNNDLYNKPESSDSTEISSAGSTVSDNDNDIEDRSTIVLNYIKPLLDTDIYGVPDEQITEEKANGDGLCENLMSWSNFTELSHEQRPNNIPQQAILPYELDDSISRVQSIEQFGPHSQSSSYINKLSIDSVDVSINYECVSDNSSQHESCEMRYDCLQATQFDVQPEACVERVESHSGEYECKDSTTSNQQLCEAQAASICEFVVISIETEDDDVNTTEYTDNKHSVSNCQSISCKNL